MRTPKEPGTEVATRAPYSGGAPASMAFAEMQQLADAIAKSRLFGITTPEQALVLMAISQAEGRHPALAARDYDIIQGRPAKKAEAMMRDFLAGGGSVEWHELTNAAAEATFSHPQGGEVRIKWDMEMARKAGLDSKENYRKFPRAMLRSRVVSEGVRTVWPTATSGFYVSEEAVDIAGRERIDVTPAAELDAFAAEERLMREALVGAGSPDAPSAIPATNGGPASGDLRDAAYTIAARGKKALREWLGKLSEEESDALRPDLPGLKQTAATADAAAAVATSGAAPQPPATEAEPAPATAPTGKEMPSVDRTPLSQPPQVHKVTGNTILGSEAMTISTPQVNPAEEALARYTSIAAVQPPQVRYSFYNEHGEVFEFDSALDAAEALIMVLDGTADTAALGAIWASVGVLRHAIVGNGNLLGEVDAAYARAAARVKPAPNGLDGAAREAAGKGLKEFHRWWLRLEPAQRKELAAKRTEYEALAKESAA